LSRLFKFKQFELDDSGAAMKLGTDAVLLGCLATHPAPAKLLDIGTGSGVIALQLAQRFAEALVTGLEIEPGAAAQAEHNFKSSAWANRLQVVQADLVDWQPAELFDMICCNPPYYENSFPIAEEARRIARSHTQLSFEQLAKNVAALLKADGYFWVVLPVAGMQKLRGELALYGLFPAEIISIFPKENKVCNREIAAFKKGNTCPEIARSLSIRAADNSYTEEYKKLTEAFYLHLK
jgi:tRNA1Val (adenine37-N6)-methyltransferase